MNQEKSRESSERYEKALKCGDTQYTLRLFVAGITPKSQRAIESVRELCDKELKGCYELEIVDIYQQPELVREEQILAAPTLIKKLPLPLRKIIGDLTDKGRVLVALDLTPKCE